LSGAEGRPQPWRAPALRARLRVEPADFRVEELPSFEATGAGEHWLLEIEKTGANTAWVAGQLARWAGIAPMGVGYAGLKDRHAVTTQRFSLHLPRRQAPDPASLDIPGVRLLAAHWHSRKLGRGALAGNRFVLRLRGVEGDAALIESRLQAMRQHGVPNYFGAQRFGRDGGNMESARRMFAGERVRREQRSILISAARSALFNAVLAERVRLGCWDRGLHGEVWNLDGRGSVFGPESDSQDDALASRCAAGEIHPTGPLWGRGAPRCSDEALALETRVLADQEEVRRGLEQAGLDQERRALRLMPRELGWAWFGSGILDLRFHLPPGSYATAVLEALGDVVDAAAHEGPATGAMRDEG
jgi:tRNA pseudouridine13 synthase